MRKIFVTFMIIFSVLMLAVAAILIVSPSSVAKADTLPGPYVTFLFSRGEQVPAINCVPDSTGTANLNTVVAPYMTSLGLKGTVTVDSLHTSNVEGCTHNISGANTGESILPSWSDLQYLTTNYGWSSTEHLYLTPAKVANLTPSQSYQDTCGQIPVLNSHNLLNTDGMIAYPGAQSVQTNLQTNYGQTCYAWGRQYNPTGITTPTDAQTSPYWQHTLALKGGPGKGSPAYTNPQSVINIINNLQPGQWLTIQVYLLVTDVNPSGDTITWNCNQPGLPNSSSDVERYCYSDFQQIAQAVANNANITVTDPLTVATAFGRAGF